MKNNDEQKSIFLNTEERLTIALEAGNMAWWEMELPSGEIVFNHNKTRMLGLKGEDFKHFQDFKIGRAHV